MFRIDKKRKTIHLTRGDYAPFTICLPITDDNDYILYKDTNDLIYWYDEYNEQLYDEDYNESNIDIDTLELQLYEFQYKDVIRFKVIEAKNMSNIILSKDFVVNEISKRVPVELTSEETKIGEIIDKPIDYWYEVELNPDTKPTTVICYDQKGKKIFRLYPEGDDKQ
jgi:hypothetical protein